MYGRRRGSGRYTPGEESAPQSVFELMDESEDGTFVAGAGGQDAGSGRDGSERHETGGRMEWDRWHLLITAGVFASLVVGLIGIALGAAALGKPTAPAAAPPPTPSAVVLSPSSGTKVSGSTWFDVQPASSSKVSTCTLVATGGSLHGSQIAVLKPTLGGWVAIWDTTTVPNATYRVSAMVYNDAGRSGRGPAISVTVQN